MSRSNHKGRIEELEGLRGIAAVSVLVYHAAGRLQPLGAPFEWFMAWVEPLGGLAVVAFFILSGFVIGYIHDEPWNRTNVLKYLLRRFIRLYPIYLIALLLSFQVARQSIISWQFFAHLVFLQGTLYPVVSSDGPLWSLHYEAIYYLLYLVLWRFPNSLKWFAGLSLVAVFAGIWNSLTLIHVFAMFGFWLFGNWLAKARSPNALVLSGNGRFWFPFLLLCGNIDAGAWSGIAKHLGGVNNAWELTVAANSPLIVDIFLSVKRRQLVPWLAYPAYGVSWFVTCLDLAYGMWSGKFYQLHVYPVAAFFLLLAATAWARHWLAPSSRSWSKVSFLGGISYALYVIHKPLIVLFSATAGAKLHIVGGCLFAVALSFLFAWLLERRFQPWVANYLKVRLRVPATS